MQRHVDPIWTRKQEGRQVSLKLYVLIHSDLDVGQQAVQAGHALVQFACEHGQEFREWNRGSNTLIYLEVPEIEKWAEVLRDGGFRHSVFREPDAASVGATYHDPYSGEWEDRDGWDGMDTAIAVAPNWTTQYLLFNDLPLAFTGAKKGPDVEYLESTLQDRWKQISALKDEIVALTPTKKRR